MTASDLKTNHAPGQTDDDCQYCSGSSESILKALDSPREVRGLEALWAYTWPLLLAMAAALAFVWGGGRV